MTFFTPLLVFLLSPLKVEFSLVVNSFNLHVDLVLSRSFTNVYIKHCIVVETVKSSLSAVCLLFLSSPVGGVMV
ncbi:unnamed protein product [Heterobilharzia americana]|nr:unnamed protein product [Heterobilharzia americana]